MRSAALQEAAAMLARARLGRERLAGLPSGVRPSDEVAAYAVQREMHVTLRAAGLGERVGHKIGCTTPVMQRFLGIPNPCAGGVFSGEIQASGAVVRFDRYLHVGIECEIAIRLARDLPMREAPYTHAEIAAAIDSAMPAIEIVDDRWVDYRAVDTPTLIADDFFNSGCVLGAPVKVDDANALAAVAGVTIINGQERGSGRGADVLGHPLNAIAWLVNSPATAGRGLQAGEFVLTGSVVQTQWNARGDDCTVRLAGLGECRLRFQ
jgi:2-oxo-3-hexenedioate decarboxylase/2-keto-4-pentenoate hydratase